jgi:hypothetical protein
LPAEQIPNLLLFKNIKVILRAWPDFCIALGEGAELINGLIGAPFPTNSGKGKAGREKRPAARR